MFSKNGTTGYQHQRYCESFNGLGEGVLLPRAEGWLLKRKISNTAYYDAMGCYPIFVCKDWTQLHSDLALLSHDLVSLTLVTDPFGNYTSELLNDCFPDKMVRFKEHFVMDLSCGYNSISSHHKRNARKALKTLVIDICIDPTNYLDEWVTFYNVLIMRHTIGGIATFSKTAFIKQFEVPGIILFNAKSNDELVGMGFFYQQEDVAYYHLAAYSEKGYALNASFAIFYKAIEHFRSLGVKWLSLGAGAGLDRKVDDGLTRFKKGWATGTRPVYLCGRIFDHGKYTELNRLKKIGEVIYFPAYRKGEFI